MYLGYEKKYESKDKVIYELQIEANKCECTYYKNTGAIIFEPNIIENCFQRANEGIPLHLLKILTFFYKHKDSKFYPDKDVFFNCRDCQCRYF